MPVTYKPLHCFGGFVSLFVSVFILLFSCRCSKSGTEPPPPPGPDTTSHNFTWQIDTIGTTSSYLLDVEIIDVEDAWAVGQIYPDDSTLHPYGAVHWNGQRWEAKRLLTQAPAGYTSYLRPSGIIAFSKYEIWLASGGVHKYDGQHIQSYWINHFPGNPNPLLDEGQHITKLWGTSSSDLYAVGSKGAIAYYNGSDWQELNSGTEIDIQDIWGAQNPQSGEYEILAVASFNPLNPTDVKILKIQGLIVTAISSEGLPAGLSSIWFIPGKKYYAVGDGVFYTDEIGKPWEHDTIHPLLYKSAVRGNQLNDIMICGGFGLLSHFNGVGWHQYKDNELPSFFGTYGALDIQNNLVTAVGWIGDQAIILQGIRN